MRRWDGLLDRYLGKLQTQGLSTNTLAYTAADGSQVVLSYDGVEEVASEEYMVFSDEAGNVGVSTLASSGGALRNLLPLDFLILDHLAEHAVTAGNAFLGLPEPGNLPVESSLRSSLGEPSCTHLPHHPHSLSLSRLQTGDRCSHSTSIS
jgi:hypothetical protein